MYAILNKYRLYLFYFIIYLKRCFIVSLEYSFISEVSWTELNAAVDWLNLKKCRLELKANLKELKD